MFCFVIFPPPTYVLKPEATNFHLVARSDPWSITRSLRQLPPNRVADRATVLTVLVRPKYYRNYNLNSFSSSCAKGAGKQSYQVPQN